MVLLGQEINWRDSENMSFGGALVKGCLGKWREVFSVSNKAKYLMHIYFGLCSFFAILISWDNDIILRLSLEQQWQEV